MAQRSGINRALMWLRKTLEITEETEAPQVLGELLRPTIDVFGWDRLTVQEYISTSAAAPAASVNTATTPVDVMRLYLNASVRHTDTGVAHQMWIEKIAVGSLLFMGIVNSQPAEIPVGVRFGIDRWIWCEPGTRMRAQSSIALVAGALAFEVNFIDLPFGEYIQT